MWYKLGFCKSFCSFLEQIYLTALYSHTNSVITQVIVQVALKTSQEALDAEAIGFKWYSHKNTPWRTKV